MSDKYAAWLKRQMKKWSVTEKRAYKASDLTITWVASSSVHSFREALEKYEELNKLTRRKVA